MTKVPWSKAPKWAKWWTMDKHGKEFFHEEEPLINLTGGWMSPGKRSFLRNIRPDWRKQKRKRP